MFQKRFSSVGVSFLASLFVIPLAFEVSSAQSLRKPKADDFPRGVLVLDGSPVHDVGNLHVHASNWGAIGSQPGAGQPFSNAPSAEWPGGSGVEYLWVAGLWVGALKSGVPAVSTAAYSIEFRPTADARDIVYETAYGVASGHRIPSPLADDDNDGSLDEDPIDGFDNDLDGQIDEDFAGISDQMLARKFRDDVPVSIPTHNPLNLSIREESYQFAHPDFDDFVGFSYKITNDGTNVLEQVYVGLFIDGDVGHRDTPNYWEDDAAKFTTQVVDHGPHGLQPYSFPYWYDVDGDGGEASGYCGVVLFDQLAATFDVYSGNLAYEDGGDPTNDFERYESMSTEFISRDATIPRDYRQLVAVGPIDEIAPGETVEFNFALVVTPRDDFTHVTRAAQVYQGLWFDLDGNPATGVDGKEHQEHWYLPDENPLPVTITRFDARAVDTRTVRVAWEATADEGIDGFDVLRGSNGAAPRSLTPGLLSGTAREFVDKTVTPGARYEYVLVAHGSSGSLYSSATIGVDVPNAALALHQNSPNPFVESTTFGVALPERAEIEVAVFDVAGRRVATLAKGAHDAGDHEFAWNGVDDRGRRVSAGVYFYRLTSGGEVRTRKLVLMR